MIIGIVGAEAQKFTLATANKTKELIRKILSDPSVTGYTSGHCHLGGVDIWTEEIGDELNLNRYIYPPLKLTWYGGYRERNIQIAETANLIHNITVKHLPPEFTGMRFNSCYHCGTADHIKSGGCWTAKYAQRLGKTAIWHVIE